MSGIERIYNEKEDYPKNKLYFYNCFFTFAIGAINYFTPYLADDYSCVKTAKTFSSFKDIVDSTYNYYISWGGRPFSHILTNFFCLIHPVAFDLLNTLCYMTVTWIIYLICKEIKSTIFLFILVFMRCFGYVCLIMDK